MSDDDLVTVAEVTRILGVSDDTIYTWVKRDGLAPAIRKPMRFRPADLERFIEEHRWRPSG